MRRPQPGPVVAVEVLVKQQVITPVRIFLELPRPAKYRPSTERVPFEDPDEPFRDLPSHLRKRDLPAVPAGQRHAERRAIGLGELAQRFDQQKASRKPDRTAPVRVTAFDLGNGFRRLIMDRPALELKGMSLMGV